MSGTPMQVPATDASLMFAGSHDGKLNLSYIAGRACDTRAKIAIMYQGLHSKIPPEHDKQAWFRAREDGWRIVPVVVERREAWLERVHA